MDYLPLETLQQIFELACTDGGATGNSLSLTSKQIRAAARRARFHTLHVVADADGDTFQEFVAFLKRECNRVLELPGKTTLAMQDPQPSSATPDMTPEPLVVPQEHLTRLRSREHAAQELIRLVAPDLWTVVVDEAPDDLHGQCPILEHTFPLLRDVTLIRSSPNITRLLRADAKLSHAIFPRATHLHLLPFPYTKDLHLSAWSILAPRVTHLRVSDVRSRHHIAQLAVAVGVPVPQEGSPVALPPAPQPLPRTYLSVRCLLVDAAAWLKPRERGYDPARRGKAAMRRGLEDIVRECRRTEVGVQATLLQAPGYASHSQAARALVDQWLEQAVGGKGWWNGLEGQ
ncbi:uncharacterized protein TRAVEDRAFT_51359 [Trametes versicolor FP-101664 SS1]|uniref:uncharacterized protein n=1 Tax=Trametes versicolor (strain FP-101664) TaxID=717944 RepID=UPI0004623781|nr:uncharacterized protein TRAVEDRAFT_51359 [Trametes versicolor FP-101664 SS1]EIW55234.1 hypothetical protein TRAVEDRAFT_51359 [Trametes versicolor FP-101664 SS1]